MMNDPVDMVQFVAELEKRPKGKAAIVLTHDYPGQKEWAAELAMQTGAEHLHMLDIFSENPELARNLSLLMVSGLFDFIHKQSKEKMAIVSGMEFIKSTWSGQPSAKIEFANRVQTWHHTPHILFVVQHDPVLASHDFGRRYNYRFIVDQKDTLKL
jgi:NAD(P)H-hydrate repair Nnr-like enzyme with NAD(P)H-hydrate dehydratase domain